jgi:ornithine carbamoyltransferase
MKVEVPMPSHLLKLRDLTPEELKTILRQGIEIKTDPGRYRHAADACGALLLFEKTSTRTTLSYQSAIAKMGGYSIVLDWDKSNFSISPIKYETQYASRNCDIVVARLKKHASLRELAENSQVPVINGCDDRYHPSQALADFMTILEVHGGFEGVTLCYVGVYNNVATCLVEGCIALGIRLLLVTPLTNEAAVDEELDELAARSGLIERRDDLAAAAREADFVYTDTWIDMENFNDPAYAEEKQRRIELMTPYQVNRENLGGAEPHIMHDMPIHPGFEISAEMVESPRSVIYQQGENRMHAQKALLLHLLNKHAPSRQAGAGGPMG